MARLAFWLLLSVAILFSTSSGLDQSEEASLSAILESFPSLRRINPFYQFEFPNKEWGGSWDKNISQICANDDGWDVLGIHCLGHHVNAIRFSGGWGSSVGDLPDLSGLTYLSNFSVHPVTMGSNFPFYQNMTSVHEFMASIFKLPSLRSLDMDWEHLAFPSEALQSANLTHVRFHSKNLYLPFISMSCLEEVDLDYYYLLDVFVAFGPSAASLRSLIIRKSTVTDSNGLSDLISLESLDIRTTGRDFLDFPAPSSLKTLVVDNWPSDTFNFTNKNLTLESLTLTKGYALTSIPFLPSTLKRLVLGSCPFLSAWDSFPSLCQLEHFEMNDMGSLPIPSQLQSCENLKSLYLLKAPPSFLDALVLLPLNLTNTPLNDFSISGDWPNATMLPSAQDWLCTLPESLTRLSLRGSSFHTFPSCVNRFESLESLDVAEIKRPSNNSFMLANFTSNLKELVTSIDAVGYVAGNTTLIHWQTLVERFRQLKVLKVTQPLRPRSSPFPGNEIKQLLSLETLEMPGLELTGSLPTDFFEKLNKLKFCYLYSNSLSGVVPGGHWASLVSLELASNQFSAWSSGVDAPALQIVGLSYNRLESIPTDADFLGMTNLSNLRLSYNPQLTTMPRFWANASVSLNELDFSDCAMVGPVPSPIYSPYIRRISLGNNRLCGPLPEVSAPVALEFFRLSNNRFIGSIPASWAENLTISALTVGNNSLSGTIPDNFISGHSHTTLTVLSLSDNYLTGPIPFLGHFTRLGILYLEGDKNTFDFCARDPGLPDVINPCLLQLDPSICNCLDSYASCVLTKLYNISNCHITTPDGFDVPSERIPPRGAVVPPTQICSMYPDDPAPLDASCPQPSPGPAFYCDKGIWKAPGSVTQPLLTVPGSYLPGTTTIIIIEGNLTVTQGGVTFNGFESQVIINGCIFLSDNQVTIELTAEEVEKLAKEGKLSRTLLTTLSDNGCFGSSDLTGTKVVVTKGSGSKGCRKVKAKNNGSTKSSLTVVFEIDNSTCNMIIIIPSVIGGVLILAGVALAIGLYLRHLKYKSSDTRSTG